MALRRLPFLIVLAGCVALPPDAVREPVRTPDPSPAFEGPGPGSGEEVSLHFQVRGFGRDTLKEVAALAEQSYERIMRDTNLYSFLSGRPYPIVIYRDKKEYVEKTGLPEWSAGAALGSAIVSYEGPHLPGTLAHEMTHLIFYESIGDRMGSLRWLNEGLAVYEEVESRLTENERRMYAGMREQVKQSPIPFDQMFAFVPVTEQARLVNTWYAQCADVVRFMIERGGRVGFSLFLRRLREGAGVDEAIREGFPGQWGDSRALERAWLASLGR